MVLHNTKLAFSKPISLYQALSETLCIHGLVYIHRNLMKYVLLLSTFLHKETEAQEDEILGQVHIVSK